MSEEKNDVNYRSITQLNGITFVIPSYQRGFRWTTQQIQELLDDLYAFYLDDTRHNYCLNTIIVRKLSENKFEVIDGQQRLTALLIISKIIAALRNDEDQDFLKFDYTMEYDGKSDFQLCVKSFKENPIEPNKLNYKDIDSAYFRRNIEFILNSYKSKIISRDITTIALRSDFFNKHWSTNAEKDIIIIWSEINSNENAIDKFSKVNSGKIALTEAELIKAYFLQKITEKEKFTLKWEEIERKLSDNKFWKFITSSNDDNIYDTRIDILFDVYIYLWKNTDERKLSKIKNDDPHFISRFLSKKINEQPEEIWKGIISIFETLIDWYNDYYFYHLIGLMTEIDSRETSEIICDLYKIYVENQKSEFINKVKLTILNQKCFDPIFRSDEKTDDKPDEDNESECNSKNIQFLSTIEDINLSNEEFSYDGKYKNSIQPFLLLFNISLLLNAYKATEKKNNSERFSFEYYKSNQIQIEHINPKHLEGTKLDEKQKAALEKEWLANTCQIAEELGTQIIKENKVNFNYIARVAKLHSITNLTLLDQELNDSYKDKNFKDKRNHILSAKYGLPMENKVYGNSIIFPGTLWVFLRQYKDRDDSCNFWCKADREKYMEFMRESVFNLFKNDEKTFVEQAIDVFEKE